MGHKLKQENYIYFDLIWNRERAFTKMTEEIIDNILVTLVNVYIPPESS